MKILLFTLFFVFPIAIIRKNTRLEVYFVYNVQKFIRLYKTSAMFWFCCYCEPTQSFTYPFYYLQKQCKYFLCLRLDDKTILFFLRYKKYLTTRNILRSTESGL